MAKHKAGCATTEDDKRLELLDIGHVRNRVVDKLCSENRAAYAKFRFSYDAAHFGKKYV